jgi:hypothetical protein
MRGRRWLPAFAALIGAATALAAHAQESGRFEVRNAYVELVNGVWQLDVSLDLGLADVARQAFQEGVPLVLELEIEANVARRFLPDDEAVSMTRSWEVAFDAITQRFVVTDTASGAHVSHATQEEAISALSRLGGIVIGDTAALPEGRRFDMRVRATVEVGDLPAPVRMLLFWKGWSRSTEWYAWEVRP